MVWVHTALDLVGFRRRQLEAGDGDEALMGDLGPGDLGEGGGHQPDQHQVLARLQPVHQLDLLTRPDPELTGGSGGVVSRHPGHLATQRLQ